MEQHMIMVLLVAFEGVAVLERHIFLQHHCTSPPWYAYNPTKRAGWYNFAFPNISVIRKLTFQAMCAQTEHLMCGG